MSKWPETTMWWHVYPLGFTGAPVRPGSPEERALTPRLNYITDHLDYLISLGLNGLALGPIFTSQSHGYDTLNFFEIDPRLGTMDDFHALISACHDRGIRVMLDGVFNHVGKGSNYDHLTADTVFEGHGDLLTLDHSSPEVVALVAEVMSFWLSHGIDAWRLDAAYSVPVDFWGEVIPQVRQQYPDAWFMGEVIHGDYPAFAAAMDSVTQYELWKSIWSSLRDENFFELDWNLKRHNELLDAFVPLTFVGNHDVTRIATQVGQAKAALALVILMTTGGIPAIYYGDECGYEGTKEERLGGDDDVRPYFHRNDNAMFELHQRLIAMRRRHPWLTRSKPETISLENTALKYRSVGANGEEAIVSLTLDDAPTAVIEIAGEAPIQVSLS